MRKMIGLDPVLHRGFHFTGWTGRISVKVGLELRELQQVRTEKITRIISK